MFCHDRRVAKDFNVVALGLGPEVDKVDEKST